MNKPSTEHILHYLPDNINSFLDVGCNVGESLIHAHQLGVKKLYGIEINPNCIEPAKENTAHIPSCEITHGSADTLPYRDKEMDVAFSSEVLEHVPQELRKSVVLEVYRVLKSDSKFIISVPHRGLFGYMDPANFRLLFPKLFSILSKIVGGKGREAGFVKQKHGIVWHHHFSIEELKSLVSPQFEIEKIRYRAGFIFPICEWLLFPLYRLNLTNNWFYSFIKKLQLMDTKLQLGRFLAYDVILVMKKKDII